MNAFVLPLITAISFAQGIHALPTESDEILTTPDAQRGEPAPGRRVMVTPQEYAGTNVFHTLYLPPQWRKDGPPLPIILEYTGNYFPRAGSTGEPEGAGLGYGLSGGRFIWVSLPYISTDRKDNQITWWGDIDATVDYAKRHVPSIINEYNADRNNVFLCGFSRGAIGVNFLGLHDDDASKLWTAFVTHDHFDGVKAWGRTTWGSPLAKYRQEAGARLQRVGDRPYLVSQNGTGSATEDYVRSVLPDVSNYVFSHVKTAEALGAFPNRFAIHSHNDRWLSRPSRWRTKTWQWMNDVVARRQSRLALGQLVFEDRFERTESQELTDEPGNEWTTSSNKTAGGNKQVDLRDGTLHIFTHATANHATSVRHTFAFRDGTIALRFRLSSEKDSLKLNFTDLACRTVHAGHLFNVDLHTDSVILHDRKTGDMNLTIRQARKAGSLSPEQKDTLAARKKRFDAKLPPGTWHEVYAHVRGDRVSVELNGHMIGSFRAPGFAHETKSMIRLLVPHTATVDDVRIWRAD